MVQHTIQNSYDPEWHRSNVFEVGMVLHQTSLTHTTRKYCILRPGKRKLNPYGWIKKVCKLLEKSEIEWVWMRSRKLLLQTKIHLSWKPSRSPPACVPTPPWLPYYLISGNIAGHFVDHAWKQQKKYSPKNNISRLWFRTRDPCILTICFIERKLKGSVSRLTCSHILTVRADIHTSRSTPAWITRPRQWLTAAKQVTERHAGNCGPTLTVVIFWAI